MAVIGLDWDGTFTIDKQLWSQFCRLAFARDHEVYIITRRDQDESPISLPAGAEPYVKEIIYTSHQQKKEYVEGNCDLRVDVWIDDQPSKI